MISLVNGHLSLILLYAILSFTFTYLDLLFFVFEQNLLKGYYNSHHTIDGELGVNMFNDLSPYRKWCQIPRVSY